MDESIAQIGPSYYEVRMPLLAKAKKEIDTIEKKIQGLLEDV